MPLLFYGRIDNGKRRLYGKGLRLIETEIFDGFKVKHLAPYEGGPDLANFWWFMDRAHSVISWHDVYGKEQTIFIPSLMKQIDALLTARMEFDAIMPGALTFRWNNENEVYYYHD